MKALDKLKVGYEIQTPLMGGRSTPGGAVGDFYIPSLRILIAVQGTYWHYNAAHNDGRDLMQRTALESMGIRVIYIDEPDALSNADYFVKEALEGRDHSRITR